jgi:acetate kinase
MKVLVLNSGSSSLKFTVFSAQDGCPAAWGIAERIGEPQGRLEVVIEREEQIPEESVREGPIRGHREALGEILEALSRSGVLRDGDGLYGIGHRVVHGGEGFREPMLLAPDVVEAIRKTVFLAPLHNPANLAGIEEAMALSPETPQVAVFDTAFHQTLPPRAFLYALPYRFYRDQRIRRYGFHGTSHQYVAHRAAEHLGLPLSSTNLITLHLGNGASAAAIRGGRSVDTSMGLTPVEGLMMGTRCGDLDPSIPLLLADRGGMTPAEVDALLNRESGLAGFAGTNDMREILRMAWEGHEEASLALEIYCYRIRKYIGAYLAVLGRTDAIVFTGGIGENAAPVRKMACEGLEELGIVFDGRANESVRGDAALISLPDSRVKVLVVKTDEEREIARLTVACIRASGRWD